MRTLPDLADRRLIRMGEPNSPVLLITLQRDFDACMCNHREAIPLFMPSGA